jgi:hypothetical protein
MEPASSADRAWRSSPRAFRGGSARRSVLDGQETIMKRRTRPTKLALSRLTLRKLDAPSLRRVAGGTLRAGGGIDILIGRTGDDPEPSYYQDSHCLC